MHYWQDFSYRNGFRKAVIDLQDASVFWEDSAIFVDAMAYRLEFFVILR